MNTQNEPQIALLGFLTRKPMHGYDIYKEITQLSGLGIVWHVKTGRLYAMLHKLEDQGYIHSRISQEGNRPQKTEYSITKDGQNAFGMWLAEPVRKGRDFRITFLLKLFFALERDQEQAKKLIDIQMGECKSWLDNFPETDQQNGNDFNRIVGKFRNNQIQGYINWLDWCQNHIVEEEK